MQLALHVFPSCPQAAATGRAVMATPLLLLVLTTTANADPLFQAPFMSFDTGPFAQSVAAADLNGDGHPDLVTSNRERLVAPGLYDPCFSTVSVLLGKGDGTFQPKIDYETGVRSVSVAIGDLNSDGYLDLVVANQGPQSDEDCGEPSVSVLLGNANDTFQAQMQFPVRATPTGLSVVGLVAVSDLNGDGRLDLAMAGSGGCGIWLGNGDGTFGAQIDLSSANAGGLAIADFNADGRMDLAVSNHWAHSASVLLGNGDGTFQAKTDYAVGAFSRWVVSGDLDADGRPDLVVGCDYPDTLTVLLGNGDGSFRTKTNLGIPAPAVLAIADVNMNGRLDLVGMGGIATSNAFVMRILPGQGDGTFGVETDFFTGGQFPAGLAISDFNADGKPDLGVVNSTFGVSVHLGNGDLTFGAKPDTVGTGERPFAIATANLNADQHQDLAVANAGSNAVSILLGNGDGSFQAKMDYGVGDSPHSLAIGDLNADSRPDLVVANWNNQKLSVLLGNGDGTFRAGKDVGPVYSPASVAMGDLNADGRLDLAVAAEHLRGGVSVLLGNGDGTFGLKTDYYTADNTGMSVAIADLNDDGRLDLVVVAGDFRATVSVLFGNGDGTFTIMGDLDADPYARSVAIADFNVDGRPDIVVGSASGVASVWLGSSNSWFGPRNDYSAGSSSVVIMDLDADGRLDLATADGIVSVLLGKGDGTFRASEKFGSGPFHGFVSAADLNADGRPDLAVTNAWSSTISIFLNHSAPPFPFFLAFDLSPGTLNLSSRGHWVSGYLEPTSPHSPGDIDVASVRLNKSVPVDPGAPASIGDHDGNGIPDLMVKFDRVALELTLSEGDDVPIQLTGLLAGQAFSGTAHIRVRRGVVSLPALGSRMLVGAASRVQWVIPAGAAIETVTLLQSLDGGSTWSRIAGGVPNSGSYPWTVPDAVTDHAVVAVLAESASGATDGVLGVSDRFSIEAAVGVDPIDPAPLALAIRASVAGGRLRIQIALPDASPARLELADVSGRMLRTIQVGDLGAGIHSLDLDSSEALRSGIYFLRLTQGRSQTRARAAVLN